MSQSPLAGGTTLPQNPIVDPKSGMPTFQFIKWFQDAAQRLQSGLDILGNLIGNIAASAHVVGRAEPIGTTLQNIDTTGTLLPNGIDFSRAYVNKTLPNIGGVALPSQLPAATPTTQGAVTTALFDAAGSAAAAQAAAEAASDPVGSAATAQTNAEAYTDAKFTGAVAHTVTLAKLTVGGSNGSLTFNSNGLLTAFVDPT